MEALETNSDDPHHIKPSDDDILALQIWRILNSSRIASNPFNNIYLLRPDGKMQVMKPNEYGGLVDGLTRAIRRMYPTAINLFQDQEHKLNKANDLIHTLKCKLIDIQSNVDKIIDRED